MRKVTMVFAVSTAVFAASTLYFARQVKQLRETQAMRTETTPSFRHPAAPPTVVDPPAAAPAARFTMASTPVPQAADAGPREGGDMSARMRAFAVAQIPRWRRVLESPAMREKTRRESAERFTHGEADLRDYVDMTDEEFRRLANLLAEQDVKDMEAQYQCALDPGCDVAAASQESFQERRRQIAALLGAERKQQFENYIDNTQERSSVQYLRGQLPDSQPLSDLQVRQLVDVLGEERRQFVRELLQTGATPSAIYTAGTGATFPGTARSVEEKVSAAQEYQRRMRERASRILDAQQLEVFTRIQGDWLASVRASWEYDAQYGATQ